jgi:single-stranded DNA-binding protein
VQSLGENIILDLKTQDDSATADGKPNTVFVRIFAFGQHVAAARAIKRGDRVYVEGQLQVSIWQSDDTVPRLNLTIKAFTVQKTGIGRNRPPRADRTSCRLRSTSPNRKCRPSTTRLTFNSSTKAP